MNNNTAPQGCGAVGTAVSAGSETVSIPGGPSLTRGDSGVPRGGEPTELHTLHAVLTALRGAAADGQLVVDMFVNYDCDPQAPPLFERTIQVSE